MQDNLLGLEDKPEISTPEGQDRALLAAWSEFKSAWALRGEAADGDSRTLFFLRLEQVAQRVMLARPTTLQGIRAKLILTLCSGHDAGLFLRHYVEGQPLPDLLPFLDPNSSQVFDAIRAIEEIVAAEAERTQH